uniref:Uncharacterized protein n=1 Tax=Arundo donax TaxID=35708 RepID=A0A0A9ERL2_ARUDO
MLRLCNMLRPSKAGLKSKLLQQQASTKDHHITLIMVKAPRVQCRMTRRIRN